MAKEYRNFQMEICTRASTKMVSLQVLASTTGQMAATSKENSKTVYVMVREYGNARQEIAINMKVVTKMIKNQGTAYSPGQLVIFTKEITKQMSEVGMVRCTGLTEVTIVDNGRMVFKMETVNFMCLARV